MGSRVWIAIPARGGSKGIPRKNMRRLNGKPLIAYTIETSLHALGDAERVVVITDDTEIARVANDAGASVILESQSTPDGETLDEKILRNIPEFIRRGAHPDDVLLTLQPTSPLLTAGRIHEAARLLEAGARSVITAVSDKSLRWQLDDAGAPEPKYRERLNRQALPDEFRETGGIIGARIADIEQEGTRVITPVSLLVLDEHEAIDIDTFADFVTAEHWLTRLSLVIRADASSQLGMGHVYRALAIALELSRHDVLIVTSAQHPLGAKFFADHPFEVVEVESDAQFASLVHDRDASLVIVDVLDTSEELISRLRDAQPTARVVSFEDMGRGAEHVDLMVSELIENPRVHPSRQLTGIANAVLSPVFESADTASAFSEKVRSVLVLFGGTDPSDLAEKSLRALEQAEYSGRVVLVRGLGAPDIDVHRFALDITKHTHVRDMAAIMAEADLALSSAGRTLIELAEMGVPTVCIAQNNKELLHQHATQRNGVVMLGLGAEVETEHVADTLRELIADPALREELHRNALDATRPRRNQRVLERVLERVDLPTVSRL